MKNKLKIVAVILTLAELLSLFALPAHAQYVDPEVYSNYVYSELNKTLNYVNLEDQLRKVQKIKEQYTPEKGTYTEAMLKDAKKGTEAATLVKAADVGNKLAQKTGEWWHSGNQNKYWDKYEAIKKKKPRNHKKFKQWMQDKKDYKKISKQYGEKGKALGKTLGAVVDGGFAAYGFYQMYDQPDIGFKSPFIEFCGNTLRGASAAATFAYRFVLDKTGKVDPKAVAVSIAATAAETTFNSETSKKFFNEKVPRIPYVDDFWDGVNEFWQVGIDYYFGGKERDTIAKNNAQLEELQKKCKGATFQGSGVGVYKPNIYLYPTDQTQVDVSFGIPSLLTVTDPPYKDGWSVTALPNGTLYLDGQEYGYLFYESETYPDFWQTSEGFVIHADKRETEFRDILTRCGLNERETADFCEFWCSKLEDGRDYAMYPQFTQAVDAAMPAEISPQPDTFYRVWFAFVKDGTPEREPELQAVSRTGFTAVEWGGLFLTTASRR